MVVAAGASSRVWLDGERATPGASAPQIRFLWWSTPMPMPLCQPARAWLGSPWGSDSPSRRLTPPECFAAQYQFRGSQHTSRRDTTRPNGIDETIQQRATALIEAAMHGQPPEVKLLLKSFQHSFGANNEQGIALRRRRTLIISHFSCRYLFWSTIRSITERSSRLIAHRSFSSPLSPHRMKVPKQSHAQSPMSAHARP